MEQIVLLDFGRSAFDEAEFAGGNKNSAWNICAETERSGRGHWREAELSASERGKEREWKVPGKCLGCEGTLGEFRLSQQQTGGI